MSTVRYLALATAAFSLASCSLFKKGEENYDTVDGGAYDTSDPYGVPGEGSGESVPYQPVNPPADNPTYGQAAYEEAAPVTPDHSAPVSPAPSTNAAGTSHTVVRGDTLGGIARRYGASASAIKQANGMTSDTVVLGKKLVIPGSSGPVASAPATGNTHLVSKGDTLSRIASKYGTTAEAIKKANGMKSDTVVLGTKLRIP
jgi:LysM repeat protein